MIKIAPSILAADLACLREQLFALAGNGGETLVFQARQAGIKPKKSLTELELTQNFNEFFCESSASVSQKIFAFTASLHNSKGFFVAVPLGAQPFRCKFCEFICFVGYLSV